MLAVLLLVLPVLDGVPLLGLTVVLLLDAVPASGFIAWVALPLGATFWLPLALWFVVPVALLVALVFDGDAPLAVPVPPLLLGAPWALLPPELGAAEPDFTLVSVLPAVPAVGAADWLAVAPAPAFWLALVFWLVLALVFALVFVFVGVNVLLIV